MVAPRLLCALSLFAVLPIAFAGDPPPNARAIRLFFSTAGLSNVANENSAADSPVADMGMNPSEFTQPGETQRFYLWAQLSPPGPPNTVTYHGISLRVQATGAGGAVEGFRFFNYTNGDYVRWHQSGATRLAANDVEMAGLFAAGPGEGVNNTNEAFDNDGHYIRAIGGDRADVTLLGYVDVAGAQLGTTELRFFVGHRGIAQRGTGEFQQPVYMGWGDDEFAPMGTEVDTGTTPLADARLVIIPEPAFAGVIALVLIAIRRRCSR